jgi:hypothetical protein
MSSLTGYVMPFSSSVQMRPASKRNRENEMIELGKMNITLISRTQMLCTYVAVHAVGAASTTAGLYHRNCGAECARCKRAYYTIRYIAVHAILTSTQLSVNAYDAITVDRES